MFNWSVTHWPGTLKPDGPPVVRPWTPLLGSLQSQQRTSGFRATFWKTGLPHYPELCFGWLTRNQGARPVSRNLVGYLLAWGQVTLPRSLKQPNRARWLICSKTSSFLNYYNRYYRHGLACRCYVTIKQCLGGKQYHFLITVYQNTLLNSNQRPNY
jgi:hypothetical protein